MRSNYSHFVPIPTLRTSNSGIALRKVRILTSPDKGRILTLRRSVPELYRFSLCAEHINLKENEIKQVRQKRKKKKQLRQIQTQYAKDLYSKNSSRCVGWVMY